jgi:hypothetical protein
MTAALGPTESPKRSICNGAPVTITVSRCAPIENRTSWVPEIGFNSKVRWSRLMTEAHAAAEL